MEPFSEKSVHRKEATPRQYALQLEYDLEFKRMILSPDWRNLTLEEKVHYAIELRKKYLEKWHEGKPE